MNRRDLTASLAAGGLGLLAGGAPARAQGAMTGAPAGATPSMPYGPTPSFIALLYPGMIVQDLVGPMTVFNLTMGKTHLVARDRAPVATDLGIPLAATHTFDDCPREADVLFVPGGLVGTTAMLDDAPTLAFLREFAPRVRYVTSVCTGSLLLGAAGLLKGKRATSHWYTRDLLPLFGAIPAEGRVVEDGNLITGGGVTAGIDFGLVISARLRGEGWARRSQLTLEYDPQPPFVGGTPAKAGEEATRDVLKLRAPALAKAREASERAGAKVRA